MKRLSATAVALIACGCATPYQRMGATGGFEEIQLDQVTYRIRAQGNGFTSMSQVQDYVLLRAAELAKSRGYSHFVMLGGNSSTQNSSFTMPGQYQATTTGQVNAYGNTAYGISQTYGTYTPGQTINVTKPRHEAIIRLQNGAAVPGGGFAMEAQSVYNSLAPRVAR